MTNAEHEGLALAWLEALDRLPWKETSRAKADGQITIRLCPHGNITRPDGTRVSSLFHVRVTLPGMKAIRGSGNSLMAAVRLVWRELHQQGIYFPPPDRPHITREQWVAHVTRDATVSA